MPWPWRRPAAACAALGSDERANSCVDLYPSSLCAECGRITRLSEMRQAASATRPPRALPPAGAPGSHPPPLGAPPFPPPSPPRPYPTAERPPFPCQVPPRPERLCCQMPSFATERDTATQQPLPLPCTHRPTCTHRHYHAARQALPSVHPLTQPDAAKCPILPCQVRVSSTTWRFF